MAVQGMLRLVGGGLELIFSLCFFPLPSNWTAGSDIFILQPLFWVRGRGDPFFLLGLMERWCLHGALASPCVSCGISISFEAVWGRRVGVWFGGVPSEMGNKYVAEPPLLPLLVVVALRRRLWWGYGILHMEGLISSFSIALDMFC